jgi:hypothetical protein
MEKVVERGMCRSEGGLPKSTDVGETIEAPPQVTIVFGYECRARAQAGDGKRNVGAIAGERVEDDGDERDRAFGRVIANLSIHVRTEPGVTHRAAGGTGQQGDRMIAQ